MRHKNTQLLLLLRENDEVGDAVASQQREISTTVISWRGGGGFVRMGLFESARHGEGLERGMCVFQDMVNR